MALIINLINIFFLLPRAGGSVRSVRVANKVFRPHRWYGGHRTMSIISSASPAPCAVVSSTQGTNFT